MCCRYLFYFPYFVALSLLYLSSFYYYTLTIILIIISDSTGTGTGIVPGQNSVALVWPRNTLFWSRTMQSIFINHTVCKVDKKTILQTNG